MLNQPTSSPMMTRILGFWPCWAEAGMLAIVVVVLNTTRAPQIVLNRLMVASSMAAADAWAAAFAPLHPRPLPIHAGACFWLSIGRHRGREFGRCAPARLCSFGKLIRRIALQSGRGRFTKDVAVCYRKPPKFQEMMVAGD